MKRLSLAALACTALALAQPAGASIVFSDNFDDGDVSDWTATTNYPPAFEGGTTGATVSSFNVSAPWSLETFLDKPVGGTTVFDIVVRASHDFTAGSGNHFLALFASSDICQGCTISYDILVDGVLLERGFSPLAFVPENYALGILVPGTHSLTLGMHTTVANNGRFSAFFDDVVIRDSAINGAIPEPGTWAMMLTGFMFAGGALRLARRRVLATA